MAKPAHGPQRVSTLMNPSARRVLSSPAPSLSNKCPGYSAASPAEPVLLALPFPMFFSPDGKPSTGTVCCCRRGASLCSLGLLALLLPRCLESMMASWDMPRKVQKTTGFTRRSGRPSARARTDVILSSQPMRRGQGHQRGPCFCSQRCHRSTARLWKRWSASASLSADHNPALRAL